MALPICLPLGFSLFLSPWFFAFARILLPIISKVHLVVKLDWGLRTNRMGVSCSWWLCLSLIPLQFWGSQFSFLEQCAYRCVEAKSHSVWELLFGDLLLFFTYLSMVVVWISSYLLGFVLRVLSWCCPDSFIYWDKKKRFNCKYKNELFSMTL